MIGCGYECHMIGGPWIAENPDCPVHGRDAQMRQEWADDDRRDLEERLARMEARLDALERKP